MSIESRPKKSVFVDEILRKAQEEARQQNQNRAGTEHLLRACAKSTVGKSLLTFLELNPDALLLLELFEDRGTYPIATAEDLPFTGIANRVFEVAIKDARDLSPINSIVTTVDLIHALYKTDGMIPGILESINPDIAARLEDPAIKALRQVEVTIMEKLERDIQIL